MAQDTCKLTGKRVLIVNHDEEFGSELTQALENSGFAAQTVHTAAEGLSMVGMFKPLVMIPALILENHDSGFRLTEKIKLNPLTSHIGIVMVTANHEKTGYAFSQEKDGKWMRTDRYFERPVEMQEIVNAVSEVANEVESLEPQMA